jgi:hypothetical protein
VAFEPADERDAPMAQRDEVRHRLRRAFGVRHRHQVHVGQMHRAIEHDERDPGLEELAVDSLVLLRRDDQEAGHAFGAEGIEVDALALVGAVGIR